MTADQYVRLILQSPQGQDGEQEQGAGGGKAHEVHCDAAGQRPWDRRR